MYKLVEKDNVNAVHGLFDTLERATWFLENTVPEYVRKGYYSDKTLTKDSFKIVEAAQ